MDDKKDRLPPIPQSWFDDNRQRFNAETTAVEIPDKRCPHYFIRKTPSEVGCKNCPNGWIDSGLFKIKDGRITST